MSQTFHHFEILRDIKIVFKCLMVSYQSDEPNSPSLSIGSCESNGSANAIAGAGAKTSAPSSLDFKLIVDDVKSGKQINIHLAAPTKQEKAAWITDITQVTNIGTWLVSK